MQRWMHTKSCLVRTLCGLARLITCPTATPELYGEFVTQGGAEAFVTLLSHENNDIVGQVTELLRDMTDDDAVEDQVRAG